MLHLGLDRRSQRSIFPSVVGHEVVTFAGQDCRCSRSCRLVQSRWTTISESRKTSPANLGLKDTKGCPLIQAKMDLREWIRFVKRLQGTPNRLRMIYRRLRLNTADVDRRRRKPMIPSTGVGFQPSATVENVHVVAKANRLFDRGIGPVAQGPAVNDDEADRPPALPSCRIVWKHCNASWITSSVLKYRYSANRPQKYTDRSRVSCMASSPTLLIKSRVLGFGIKWFASRSWRLITDYRLIMLLPRNVFDLHRACVGMIVRIIDLNTRLEVFALMDLKIKLQRAIRKPPQLTIEIIIDWSGIDGRLSRTNQISHFIK